jgi:hypothetical protein
MNKKRTLIHVGVALIAAIGLLSCAAPPPKQKFADITYGHLPPYMFNVARVDVVSEFKPKLEPPYVEQQFPIPPERAIRQWIHDRIKPAGTEGVAKVVINDASVKEVELLGKKDLESKFTTEQTERYEAVADVTINIYGTRGFRDGYTEAHVERSQTVPEDATLNGRELIWYNMTDALMKDFNTQMEQNIRTYLQKFLVKK